MDPVVLLPGLQSDGSSWLPLCQRLVGHRPLVIPFGHQHADTMAAMAETVLHQCPPRFHLVGWSMGGYIAFEILRRAPERMLSLSLISTTAAPESDAGRARRAKVLTQAQHDGMRRYQDANMDECLFRPAALARSDRDNIVTAAATLGFDAFRAQIRAVIARADSRHDLERCACPTLIVTGEQDRIVPPEDSRHMHALLPGSRLVQLPECGHCPPLEKPDEVGAILCEWFALSGRPAADMAAEAS